MAWLHCLGVPSGTGEFWRYVDCGATAGAIGDGEHGEQK